MKKIIFNNLIITQFFVKLLKLLFNNMISNISKQCQTKSSTIEQCIFEEKLPEITNIKEINVKQNNDSLVVLPKVINAINWNLLFNNYSPIVLPQVINSITRDFLLNKKFKNLNLKEYMWLIDIQKKNVTFIEKIPKFTVFTFLMSFNLFIFKNNFY